MLGSAGVACGNGRDADAVPFSKELALVDLQICVLKDLIVAAGYSGRCTLAERLDAKERIAGTANEAGTSRVLIDLSQATIEPYGPKESLEVVRRVAADPAFGRLAYVHRPRQPDFIARLLATGWGQNFRHFDDTDAALHWLGG